MGAVWLHDMPGWLSRAGLKVRTWPGWETRSRASGGYDEVLALGLHHTASPSTTTTDRNCRYNWNEAEFRPIGAIVLGRDGEVVVGAAGATNTQGLGGPLTVSNGVIPKDAGNRYMVSIEAINNGVGEVWSQAQLKAYLLLCRVLCHQLDLDPMRDVVSHREWAPTRKVDPAGPPTPYALPGDQYMRWDMDKFRTDVKGVSIMALADKLEVDTSIEKRLIDTRSLGGRTGTGPNMNGVQVIPFDLHAAGVNVGDCVAVQLSVICVDAIEPGFIQAYTGNTPPQTSRMNFWAGSHALANDFTVPLAADGTFNIRVQGRTHLVVDVVGLWHP